MTFHCAAGYHPTAERGPSPLPSLCTALTSCKKEEKQALVLLTYLKTEHEATKNAHLSVLESDTGTEMSFPQSRTVLYMTGICGLADKPTSNLLYAGSRHTRTSLVFFFFFSSTYFIHSYQTKIFDLKKIIGPQNLLNISN